MFIRRFLRHVFMDQANAGEGGGAGGGDAGTGTGAGPAGDGGGQGAGTDAAGAGGAAGAAGVSDGGAAAGQAGTVLQAGAQGQGDQPAQIPEKYQVRKEDGSLDIEASSRKLAEAYGHLEKRLGSGDAPPKSADEYQITVPDNLKDAWNPKEDPKLQEFLKDAHAAGMTQKQVDMAISKYLEIAPQLVDGSQALSADECVATLKQEWKTEEQYKEGVGNAYKAAVAYAGDDADYIINTYGNDAKVIRMLDRMGREMGEDKSLNPGGSVPSGQSVESLMASEAYTNPKHADHARVSAQVKAHFDKQAEAATRAGNAPIL